MTEKQTILGVYGILIASLLCGFVPHALFAFLAIVLFTAALVAAYAIRRRNCAATLTRDHMAYIIRTIWVSGGIGFVTVIAASVYVLSNFNPAPVQGCADQMISFGDAATIEACLRNFVDVNKNVFITGTLLGAAPLIIYLVWKVGMGLYRLHKNQPPPSKYRMVCSDSK